jgi:hypothetical protein
MQSNQQEVLLLNLKKKIKPQNQSKKQCKAKKHQNKQLNKHPRQRKLNKLQNRVLLLHQIFLQDKELK